MKSCGLNTMKYFFFAFNLLFFISGLGMLVAGSVVANQVKNYSHFMSKVDLAMLVIFIITGISVFFIAFLGCCGALKENYNMLLGFAILLIAIFATELAIGIAAGVSREHIPEELLNRMQGAMKMYEDNIYDKLSWDSVQAKMECCGLEGNSEWKKVAGMDAPDSCRVPDTKTRFFDVGCFPKIKDILVDGISTLHYASISIAVFQMTGIIVAFLLACNVRTRVR